MITMVKKANKIPSCHGNGAEAHEGGEVSLRLSTLQDYTRVLGYQIKVVRACPASSCAGNPRAITALAPEESPALRPAPFKLSLRDLPEFTSSG